MIYAPSLLFGQLPAPAYEMLMNLVAALELLMGKITEDGLEKGILTMFSHGYTNKTQRIATSNSL